MQIQPRRAILVVAAFAALAIAATAWADTGSDSNGGTVADKAPPAQKSGGVAGPARTPDARPSQTTTPEQPPQVETTPTETTPSDNTGEQPSTPTDTTTDEQTGAAPSAGTGSSAGGGGGGGGLPRSGFELAALSVVGLGLLLAGVTLRRWREG